MRAGPGGPGSAVRVGRRLGQPTSARIHEVVAHALRQLHIRARSLLGARVVVGRKPLALPVKLYARALTLPQVPEWRGQVCFGDPATIDSYA